jgi:archaellum component FlaC
MSTKITEENYQQLLAENEELKKKNETLQQANDSLAQTVEQFSKVNLNENAGAKTSDEILRKVRSFAQQVESLNATVGSMEMQLSSLYGDKERLEAEIGASEVEDVIGAVRRLESVITSMEFQLMSLYAGKELLEVELGKSDPKAIVAMFRNMNHMVDGLRHELTTVGDTEEFASEPLAA